MSILWIQNGERLGAPGIVLKNFYEISTLHGSGRSEIVGLV
jgi:hypothetical protein